MLVDYKMKRKIRKLLARGLPSEQISRMVGVPQNVVKELQEQDAQKVPLIRPGLPANIVRCPGCGGLVRMPCYLCQIRADKEQQQNRIKYWEKVL